VHDVLGELGGEPVALVRRAGIEQQVRHRRRRAVDVDLRRRERQSREVGADRDLGRRRAERRDAIERAFMPLAHPQRRGVARHAHQLEHVRLEHLSHGAPRGEAGFAGPISLYFPFFAVSHLLLSLFLRSSRVRKENKPALPVKPVTACARCRR
jgi:hypothetical protein